MRNWHDAHADCLKRNGLLISIHSKWENAYIQALIGETDNDWWMGLRRNVDAEFKFSDNSSFDFENWRRREPGNNNCVELLGNSQFKWATTHCKDNRRYICTLPGKLIFIITFLVCNDVIKNLDYCLFRQNFFTQCK